MVKYLIIQLDKTSTSYCHYDNLNTEHRLISLSDLESGIFFGMKENLMIQFVYPDYELPNEYKETIDSIDHSDIVSSLCEDENLRKNADIIVFHDWTGLDYYAFDAEKAYVLRTSKADFFDRHLLLKDVLGKVGRLNVVFTDVDTFMDSDTNGCSQRCPRRWKDYM